MLRYDSTWNKQRDVYALFDSSIELADCARLHAKGAGGFSSKSWTGGMSHAECIEAIFRGNQPMVDQAEKMLARLEDQVPMSRGSQVVADVVGALPNVPAYLAGVPTNMRRRQRTPRETAPITVFMDLTSSAGVASDDVLQRGITLLALTRLLTQHRAVELWIGSALGGYGANAGSYTVAWRIDTAPIDLARAAHLIAHPAMSRSVGYGIAQGLLGSGGNWPLNSYDKHVASAKERLAVAFPGTDVLYVPPIYVTDELVKKPVDWLRRTMAQYLHTEEE